MSRKSELFGCTACVGLLFLPLLQWATSFAPQGSLAGVVSPTKPMPPLNLGNWNSGEIQEIAEQRISQQIGLRAWMIRLDNELRYRAFSSAKPLIIVGAGDFFFGPGYLPSKAVLHSFDPAKILTKLYNLLLLQEELDRHGITLLLCISPNKAVVYPEHLPIDQAWINEATKANPNKLELAAKAIALTKIRCVNFSQLFSEWRKTDPANTPPLFKQGGIHWSNYGSARAAVVLLDQLQQMSGLDIANLDLVGTATSDTPIDDEQDVALLANLLITPTAHQPSEQPILQLRPGDQGAPAKILFIGTSFTWGLTRALSKIYASGSFAVWYYFKSDYQFNNGTRMASVPLSGQASDVPSRLEPYRFVIIEINEAAIAEMGQGFIEAALIGYGITPATTVPATLIDQILDYKR
ncbi:MAG: hypothetical protein NT107_11030 [Planctomycetota bacterium]|nr:hypothetical protein [Planctomycetota bacterium]